MSARQAVVLLSGGLDSTTVLAIASAEGFAVNALSFRYGQRHAVELDAAREIASERRRRAARRRRHRSAPVRRLGSDGRHRGPKVPRARRDVDGIPITYVPARNTVFLSFAVAFAEVVGADDIWLGVNALDYSGLSGLSAGVHRGLRADGEPRHQARRRGPQADDPRPADRPVEGGDHRARSGTRRRLLADPQLLRPDARPARRAAGATAASCGSAGSRRTASPIRHRTSSRPGGITANAWSSPHATGRRSRPSRSSRSSDRRSRAKAPRPACRRTSFDSAAAITAARGATRCTPSSRRSFARRLSG